MEEIRTLIIHEVMNNMNISEELAIARLNEFKDEAIVTTSDIVSLLHEYVDVDVDERWLSNIMSINF